MGWSLRRSALFLFDLGLIALATVIALLLRDNLEFSAVRLGDLAPYIAATLLVSAIVIPLSGQHRAIWRFSVMADYLRVIASVVVIVLGAVALGFLINRLGGVARSLPLIQGLLMACLLVGARVARRVHHSAHSRTTAGQPSQLTDPARETVLVVGINPVTDLFLRSVAEFASQQLVVAGILGDSARQSGRLLQQSRILGTPEEIADVLRTLDVHGVSVDRVVVMMPFARLSAAAQQALLEIEKTSSIHLDLFAERIGLGERAEAPAQQAESGTPGTCEPVTFSMAELETLTERGYWRRKRAFDLTVAVLFCIFALPLYLLVALLVALDVGAPTVFWQQRPGGRGRPFKLYKFRTMRSAHDNRGKRLSDEDRLSAVGRFLRRTHLDELPQVFNILIGEMSFVGPRPLLPKDQAFNERLLVQPGLTGWAQINGGRTISGRDKAALDIWYVRNASAWLDISILVRTLTMMVGGEKTKGDAVRKAWNELANSNLLATGHATAAALAQRDPEADAHGGLPHAA